MPFEPQSLDQVDFSLDYMAMFMGRPGSGKSIAASSFGKKVIFFDIDGRVKPVKNFWTTHNPARLADIQFVSYEPGQYEKFAGDFTLENLKPYDNIVVDGFTSLGTNVMAYTYNFHTEAVKKAMYKGIIQVNALDDYKALVSALDGTIRVFRKLKGKIRIMTAHELAVDIKDANGIVLRTDKQILAAGNQAGPRAEGYFDEIYLFKSRPNADNNKPPMRLVRTNPDSEYQQLKTALGLPPEIDVTNKGLYEIIKPYLDKVR